MQSLTANQDEKSIVNLHPQNLYITAESRIAQLQQAIQILEDHLQKYGSQIREILDPHSGENAYTFLDREIRALQKELDLRLLARRFKPYYFKGGEN